MLTINKSKREVPIEVRPERRQALAFRWLIEFSRKKVGKSMRERLAQELMDSAMKKGASIKRSFLLYNFHA